MIAVYPVSGPTNLCVICIPAEIDAPNIGQYLLFVPVRIRFIVPILDMRYIFII